jgi:hypothetical protein
MDFLKNKKFRIVAFSILVAIAVFFSFYKLAESPSFWYDEGWYFQHAANLATGEIEGLQFAPGDVRHLPVTSVGYPLIYTMALWMKVFGTHVLSARLLMVLFIGVLLGVSFYLARRIFGTNVALASLLLLVTFPPLYGNGKSILGEVPGLFFFILSLITFHALSKAPESSVTSGKRPKRLSVILTGTLIGLCVVTKPIFILILPAFVVGIWMYYKRNTISWSAIIWGGVFALIPFVTWMIAHFGIASTSINVLEYYANPSDKSDLFATVIRNFKGVFTEVSTLFTLLITLIWSAGLWIRHRRKETITVVEIVAFVFSVLILLAFLRTEGWYRYIFQAQIVTLIFLPYSLRIVCVTCLKRLPQLHPVKIYGALIFLLALLGFYQTGFHSFVADAYGSKKTVFWEEYFVHVPASTSVFFDNTPEVVPFIQHRNYYQYISCAGGDFGTEQLAQIGKADMIVMRSEKYETSPESYRAYVVSETVYKYVILKKKK